MFRCEAVSVINWCFFKHGGSCFSSGLRFLRLTVSLWSCWSLPPAVQRDDGLQRQRATRPLVADLTANLLNIYLGWRSWETPLDTECRNPAGVCRLMCHDEEAWEGEHTDKPLGKLNRSWAEPVVAGVQLIWCGLPLALLQGFPHTGWVKWGLVTGTQHGNTETSLRRSTVTVCMH